MFSIIDMVIVGLSIAKKYQASNIYSVCGHLFISGMPRERMADEDVATMQRNGWVLTHTINEWTIAL